MDFSKATPVPWIAVAQAGVPLLEREKIRQLLNSMIMPICHDANAIQSGCKSLNFNSVQGSHADKKIQR
jgi:hypothetical protein